MNIDSFAPPKASGSTMVTIVAAIVLALVVMGGLFFRSTLTPTPTPTPSARTSAPAGAGQPFTTPDGLSGGRWQILESRWVDGGVSILVRISIDDGPVSYSFRAFPNAGSDVLESGDGPAVREHPTAPLVVADQGRSVEQRAAGQAEHREEVDEEVPGGTGDIGTDRAQGVQRARVGDP